VTVEQRTVCTCSSDLFNLAAQSILDYASLHTHTRVTTSERPYIATYFNMRVRSSRIGNWFFKAHGDANVTQRYNEILATLAGVQRKSKAWRKPSALMQGLSLLFPLKVALFVLGE
jgi:hypothetical protein